MNKDIIFRQNTERYFDIFVYFVQSDLSPCRSVPVALMCTPKTSPTPYIFYNTEQLTRPECLKEVITFVKNFPPVEIWDYSSANASILQSVGITCKHVPLISPIWYIEKLKAMRQNFSFDVGFCGCLNKRRNDIFDALKNRGLVVNVVRAYGYKRDEQLAKCRVLINIHYSESYKIFEQSRCEPWLQIGVPIVSENSLDNDERAINVTYEQLVDVTVNTVENFKLNEK